MISRFDLGQRVREWGLRDDVVEKDYVIGWPCPSRSGYIVETRS